MASEKNALRAGAFILASAVVALAVIVVVSGPDRFAPKKQYVAVFDLTEDIQGIRAGDEVRLGGVRVGTVQEVDVNTEAATPDVRVKISLPTRYKLRDGATVSVQALIGSASLNIDSLGTGSELPDNGLIDGQSGMLTRIAAMAPKIEAAIAQVQTVTLPKIDAAIDSYKALADDARTKNLPQVAEIADRGKATLESFKSRGEEVLAEAKRAMTNIGDFVGPQTDAPALDFRGTLANLKDSTNKIKEELPALTEGAKKAINQINERLDQLKGTAEDLRSAMADVKDVTKNGRELISDNRARIDRMIASLESTANNAKGFTAEVLRRPSKLIWRDDEKTQGNLNVYHSAREFSEGAEQLNSAAGSLRDALRDPRVSSEELQRRLTNLEASFERFGKVEDKLLKSVKE